MNNQELKIFTIVVKNGIDSYNWFAYFNENSYSNGFTKIASICFTNSLIHCLSNTKWLLKHIQTCGPHKSLRRCNKRVVV